MLLVFELAGGGEAGSGDSGEAGQDLREKVDRCRERAANQFRRRLEGEAGSKACSVKLLGLVRCCRCRCRDRCQVCSCASRGEGEKAGVVRLNEEGPIVSVAFQGITITMVAMMMIMMMMIVGVEAKAEAEAEAEGWVAWECTNDCTCSHHRREIQKAKTKNGNKSNEVAFPFPLPFRLPFLLPFPLPLLPLPHSCCGVVVSVVVFVVVAVGEGRLAGIDAAGGHWLTDVFWLLLHE